MDNTLDKQDLKSIRQHVMTKTHLLQNLAPPTVSYHSEGNILIIGAEDLGRKVAAKLTQMHSVILLVNEAVTCIDDEYLEKVMEISAHIDSYYQGLLNIHGFFGQFQVFVENDIDKTSINLSKLAINLPHFDIILDLSEKTNLPLEVLPPGYFYAGRNNDQLQQSLENISHLIGEFEKPRYVKINNDICAHYKNGIDGCQRCLTVCPADAINSINKQIEIDPYLCHGVGSCANTCPTGAISYDLPTTASLLTYLYQLTINYNAQALIAPIILFHGNDIKSEYLDNLLLQHNHLINVLPVSLEEISIAGLEHWLSLLAWGAQSVLVLKTKSTPLTLTQILMGEINLANAILKHINLPESIQLIDENQLLEKSTTHSGNALSITPMELTISPKRTTLFNAIDYINSQKQQKESILTLPNIPFGNVSIITDNCTLCLSCAAICPTQALTDGGEKPALYFTEQNCIQCGLCESVCPEKVINLTSQINFDRQRRISPQLLKQEKPFECIVCGQEFATQSMVQKMMNMLAEHDAFSSNLERLKMCGDCRVKDLFEDILVDPEKQLR